MRKRFARKRMGMVQPIPFPAPEAPEGASLPANVEAEAALLGAMMIDNRVAEDVLQKIRPEHFFEPLHGRIYDAISMLVGDNRLANPVTLRPMFASDAAMKELGGPAYLAQLTGNPASLIGARSFADQIYDLAQLRALVSVGRDLVDSALDTSQDINPSKQIEQAEMKLYQVAEQGGGSDAGVKSFTRAATLAVRQAEKAMNSGGGISGITTGLSDLNASTGGFNRSDLLILAGRPGMGKTSLATNIAFNAAKRYMDDLDGGIPEDKSIGAPVAFFSLEMSADQLAMRILSEQAEVVSEKLRTGQLSHAEFQKFARAAGDLERLPLYIDDTPGLTIAALRTRARRLKRQYKIGMVIVDYLQLLQGSGRASGDGRVQEISEISRGLKTLAKELHVPVLALSQLSRAVESREDKRPQLSDLRESGSIEQDADIVLFVYRDEYYHDFKAPTKVPDGTETAEERIAYEEWQAKQLEVANKATVIIAKQRHGATGSVHMRFDRQFTKFSDLVHEEY